MNYEWGPWFEHDGNGCPAKVRNLFTLSLTGGRNQKRGMDA
jgi:hypothetical protein